jgi:hypothetical protein
MPGKGMALQKSERWGFRGCNAKSKRFIVNHQGTRPRSTGQQIGISAQSWLGSTSVALETRWFDGRHASRPGLCRHTGYVAE